MAVIATLSEVMDTDPCELDPLCSSVDTDALDGVLRVRGGSVGDTHVTFTHEGHRIIAHSYGVVAITPEHEFTAENAKGA